MKAYDENAKYILFINKSVTILGCSTVNSLTIGFLGHISQQWQPIRTEDEPLDAATCVIEFLYHESD